MHYSGAVASSPRLARSAFVVIAALCLLMSAVGQARVAVVSAAPAQLKAVIIVGPTDGLTASNLQWAEELAVEAEAYGMDVRRVFHPNATWENVMANVQGANLVAYMGHGNGWPSPYAPFQENTKDGVGLNPYEGGSTSNTKYYGAKVIRETWSLAPNALVFLNHLCYSAGNAEPGMAIPNWDIARQRTDNFAAGFLAAGARAVFAYSSQPFMKTIRALFDTDLTVEEMFMTPGSKPKAYYGWIGADARKFDSVRTPGTVNFLDKDPNEGFKRAISGDLSMTAGQWRGTQSSNWTPTVVSNVPTVPQNLTGEAFDNRVVQLNWEPSTANHYGPVKYNVLRNGNSIAKSVSGTSYNDQPAKVGTFTYTVKAIDPAGVKSDSSNAVVVQAVEDAGGSPPTPSPTATPTPTPTPTPSPTPTPATGPPTVPQNLTGTPQSDLRVHLTWDASTAYVPGTLRYRVFRNGKVTGLKMTNLHYTDQLTVPGSYQYQVRAIDGAGVRGEKSAPITVVVEDESPTVVPDTVPPSKPTGLTAQSLGERRVSLSWQASTDNVAGTIEYRLFRGKKRIATLTTRSYTDQPANVGTYKYRVKAVDVAGNKSYFSAPVYGQALE